MRTLFLATYISISFQVILSAQTEVLEKRYLSNLAVESDKSIPPLDQTKLRDLSKAWVELLNDFGGYPQLPYNAETNQVEFSYVVDLEGISKDVIFTRLKEWIAIYYGSINAVLHYEDYEMGKLVAKGWQPLTIRTVGRNFWGAPKGEAIDVLKCYYTAIYTVKDQKLKIEYQSIEYESSFFSLVSSNYVTSKQLITDLYPVTASDKDTWKSRLSTLQETDRALSKSVSHQKSYINQYQSDYDF